MTREEAIKVLKSMKSEESYNALIDLCNMAIEALSAKPTSDLISRADAIAYIERVSKCGLGKNKSLEYIHKYISKLPSADAKPSPKDMLDGMVLIPQHDWIETQKKLEEYVSADRPQGEWIFKDDYEPFAGEYFCSNCDTRAEVDIYGEWILSNYCPSCGARNTPYKGGEE